MNDSETRKERLRQRLAAWWETNARDLPWRFGRTSPWGVLVSEVMSQQTQMSRVVPYWQAWMSVWPDAAALADASTAEVITAWGRLGYPRRALRLQECARQVATQYGGELPREYDELVALPGIGDYTASAVLSFAFGKRVPVIDTNIRRVLSRAVAGKESLGGSASAEDRRLAARVLPQDAGDSVVWNQSVMELGAVVCTAQTPVCESCPIAGECAFRAAGYPDLGCKRTRPRQRFAGTDRQVRGIVLEALRRAASAESEKSAGTMSAGLAREGETQPNPRTPIVDVERSSQVNASQVQVMGVSRAEVERLWADHGQLDACIASLDEDGLIEILPDGSLTLPR